MLFYVDDVVGVSFVIRYLVVMSVLSVVCDVVVGGLLCCVYVVFIYVWVCDGVVIRWLKFFGCW